MSKPLSVDLRESVVAAVDGGLSRRTAAERFGVSISSAIRWMAQVRRIVQRAMDWKAAHLVVIEAQEAKDATK